MNNPNPLKKHCISRLAFVFSVVILNGCALFFAPDEPPVPPAPPEPSEEFVDETNIILDPDDKGRILGEEVSPEFPAMSKAKPRQFRAMTYNLHLWGKNKMSDTTGLVKKNGVPQSYDVAIFSLFKSWQADIVALQEIYKTPADLTVPFKVGHDGYEVLLGKPIFTTKTGKQEFCAIVFRTSKMKCKSVAKQWKMSREIHWAQCTINPPPMPKKTFFFGCAHFAPSGVELFGNISEFFDKLYKAIPQPTVNGVGKDDFIIGGDFNSYFNGLQKQRWQRENRKFKGKVPKPEDLSFIKIKPDQTQGGFTKIHKRKKAGKEVIKIARDKSKRIIDDLFWFLRPRHIDYVNKSKKIVPVTQLKSGGTWMDFWKEYYKTSDHLPVKADFSY